MTDQIHQVRHARHCLMAALGALIPMLAVTHPARCLDGWPWPVRQVVIDARPGAYPNVLSVNDEAVEVAVLSSPSFDAQTLGAGHVALTDEDRPVAVARPVGQAIRDVDGDHYGDRVFRFAVADLLSSGVLDDESSRLTLIGVTSHGRTVVGWDRIHVAAHPVVRMPEPTGPFAVGTASCVMRDSSRPEPATADPNDVREIMVRAWFPVDRPAAQPTTYFLDDREARQNAEADGFPPRVYDFVLPNAYQGVRLTTRQRTFPVLLFSHGLNVPTPLYLAMLEQLASTGYVVFAVTHTYAAGIVVFPDGRIAPPAPLDADRLATLPAVWTDDMIFVANRIVRLDRGHPVTQFRGRLQVHRLGIWGHSLGGAVAANAMLRDRRFVAGINMDGLFHDEALERGVDRPFMLMNSEGAGLDPTRVTFLQLLHAPGYVVDVAGAGHMNFGDLGLLFPLAEHYAPGLTRSDLGLGEIDAGRGVTIAAAYASAFFDRYLLGRDSVLLHGPTGGFPEVTLTLVN